MPQIDPNQSTYHVLCECGAIVVTQQRECTCNCGRVLNIEAWGQEPEKQ